MKSRILLSILQLLPTLPLLAGTTTVQMNAFKKASGEGLDALPDSVRFGISFPGAGVENVTHLVTDPFVPVGENQEWVSAAYRGIVAGTGEVGETGTMMMSLPAASGSEGAVSPVVAVIPRDGSWEGYSLTPGSTLFENAHGGATFDANQLNLAIDIGGVEYTGSASATATGSGSLQLSPFTITAGGTSYSFSAAELQPSGESFVGEVVRLDAGVDYETLLTTVKLGSVSDYDLDGTPDLVDSAVQPWFGAHESYSNGWVITVSLGTIFPYSGSGFVYHLDHGNLYVSPQDDFLYFWDFNLGWLYSSLATYPLLYQYETSSWLYYMSSENGQRVFWNYSTEDWQHAPLNI